MAFEDFDDGGEDAVSQYHVRTYPVPRAPVCPVSHVRDRPQSWALPPERLTPPPKLGLHPGERRGENTPTTHFGVLRAWAFALSSFFPMSDVSTVVCTRDAR